MKPVTLVHAVLGLGLALFTGSASAQSAEEFDGYVVHFHSLTTDTLSPDIASAYNIRRSRTRAMLNVSVLEKQDDAPHKPVEAAVDATATNLNGQLRNLQVRPIQEGDAVYYIAEFRVSHEETLDFEIEVTPEGSNQSHTVNFRRQFFTR